MDSLCSPVSNRLIPTVHYTLHQCLTAMCGSRHLPVSYLVTKFESKNNVVKTEYDCMKMIEVIHTQCTNLSQFRIFLDVVYIKLLADSRRNRKILIHENRWEKSGKMSVCQSLKNLQKPTLRLLLISLIDTYPFLSLSMIWNLLMYNWISSLLKLIGILSLLARLTI